MDRQTENGHLYYLASSPRSTSTSECDTRGANSSIDKIAEHEKIRREKENSKQNPTRVAFAVKQNTHNESKGVFDAKQHCGFCEHLWILARGRVLVECRIFDGA